MVFAKWLPHQSLSLQRSFMYKNIPCIFFVFLLFASCGKEQSPLLYPVPAVPSDCDTAEVKYSQTIKPYIITSCSNAQGACHFAGTGNYDFYSYQVVADRIRSGTFTERILLPVSHPLHMPPGVEISDCDLAKMMTWINNGFPNN